MKMARITGLLMIDKKVMDIRHCKATKMPRIAKTMFDNENITSSKNTRDQ